MNWEKDISYQLKAPQIVTEEESYALENLFLELIKTKGELKSENN